MRSNGQGSLLWFVEVKELALFAFVKSRLRIEGDNEELAEHYSTNEAEFVRFIILKQIFDFNDNYKFANKISEYTTTMKILLINNMW